MGDSGAVLMLTQMMALLILTIHVTTMIFLLTKRPVHWLIAWNIVNVLCLHMAASVNTFFLVTIVCFATAFIGLFMLVFAIIKIIDGNKLWVRAMAGALLCPTLIAYSLWIHWDKCGEFLELAQKLQ